MKRKTFFIHTFSLFIFPLILLAGCVSPMGMTASTTPLEGKKIEIIGKAGGCSNWAGAILGLWDVNRADINRAIGNTLVMENDVTIVRKADNRELVMKKGAVLLADSAAAVKMDEAETAAAALPVNKKTPVSMLLPGGRIIMKEGKLYLSQGGKEAEVAGGSIILTGNEVKLRLVRPQVGGRTILKKIKGDMLVLIDGSPRRLADDEVLAAGEGFSLSRVTGDALVNVRWDERTYYFVLFSLHRVYVQGDVARFVKEEAPAEPADDAGRKPEPKKPGGARGR